MLATFLDTPLKSINALHLISLSALTGIDRPTIKTWLQSFGDESDLTFMEAIAHVLASRDTLKSALDYIATEKMSIARTPVREFLSKYGDMLTQYTGISDLDAFQSIVDHYAGADSSLAQLARVAGSDDELLDVVLDHFRRDTQPVESRDETHTCHFCSHENVYYGVTVPTEVFLCRACGNPNVT